MSTSRNPVDGRVHNSYYSKMVHVKIDVNKRGRLQQQYGGDASKFFAGRRFQRGFGLRRQRGFGQRRQRGRGFGSMMAKAWDLIRRYSKQYAAPVVREAARTLASEGAAAGSRILGDISQGRSAEDAFREHGSASMKRLAGKASERLKQVGGRPRKRSVKNLHVVGRSVLASTAKKRNRGASFTPY